MARPKKDPSAPPKPAPSPVERTARKLDNVRLRMYRLRKSLRGLCNGLEDVADMEGELPDDADGYNAKRLSGLAIDCAKSLRRLEELTVLTGVVARMGETYDNRNGDSIS